LKTLHAKNNFAFAIIVGDLIGPTGKTDEIQDLVNDKIDVPITTYFALTDQPLPDELLKAVEKEGQICTNLLFLGRKSTTKTSDGIRIVTLGGKFTSESTKLEEFSPLYSDADAKVLKGVTNADILITSDWPQNILTGSSVNLTTQSTIRESQSVSDLCSWLKPRYHFSSSECFYEREPFFHSRQAEDTDGYRITRFISLAPFGNTAKEKWIYAFNLDQKNDLPLTLPAGVTASPLSSIRNNNKRPADSGTTPFSRFGDSNSHRHGHTSNKRSRTNQPMPSECFFCLSNSNAATHLITSIGESSYVTTAKGPLPTNSTFSLIDFPGHMLIIPLEHTSSVAAIQDKSSQTETLKEMHRYRNAIELMISDKNKDRPETDKLGCITWEINRAAGIHFHWQVMPIPRQLMDKGLVEAAFKVQAENDSYPKFEVKKIDSEEIEREDYFRVWMSTCTRDDKLNDTVMTLYLDHTFRFDLQFGRKVIAKLLGLEGRIDWKNCGQTVAEETADAEAFKAAFKPYDFTLDA